MIVVAYYVVINGWSRASIRTWRAYLYGDRPFAGTEIYQTIDGQRYWPWKMYAGLAFHEALHNLFPYQTTDFVHLLDGGGDKGGLAAKNPRVHGTIRKGPWLGSEHCSSGIPGSKAWPGSPILKSLP
jgi:hypothetical protein